MVELSAAIDHDIDTATYDIACSRTRTTPGSVSERILTLLL